MSIRNQKKLIILLAVFTIIVIAFNKSYALFQTTAVSDKPVVQITTPDKLPKPSTGVGKELLKYDIEAKKETCKNLTIEEDGITYLSGDNDCIDFNYVWYSGKLWRITAINPDGTMKMITQDPITAIYWGENTTYQGSWIYQWLNEDFKETLYNYQNIIVQNASWNATRDENIPPVKSPTDSSATIVQGDVGTLNAYEYYQSYKNTSSSTGYLNIGYNWWLINPSSDSKIWYVMGSGSLWEVTDYGTYYGTPLSAGESVRPSVNLKSEIELRGEGTKSNPYTITGDKETGKSGELINTRLSGEYVKVDNKVYRIVGIENNTTKLTSVDYVRDEENTILSKSFAGSASWGKSVSNGYDFQWDYYLNNKWLTDNLRNYIIEGTYYLGQSDFSESYKNSICSANNTTETTKNCAKTTNTWTGLVGLPRLGEMFSVPLGERYSTLELYMWLITSFSDGYGSVFLVGNNGSLNGDGYSGRSFEKSGARPSINLKQEVKIVKGSGTVDSPYEVGL